MKSNHVILLFFLVCTLSSYSDAALKRKGITFFKGSWEEALIKAKEENKYVFIDFYKTWCGPCKKLKRTSFKDPEVGAYFNKNFINISIDAESKEGIKIARRYSVSAYPTLVITDHTGKQKTRSVGFKKPYILSNFVRRIVP